MKRSSALLKPILALLGIFVFHANPVLGEVAFQNLNFENATVPNLPPDSANPSEDATAAFPGWRIFYGSYEQTTVVHNTVPLGSTRVMIFGPNYKYQGIISGKYSACLAGAYNYYPDQRNASIAQTGTVPVWANGIQFMVSPWAHAFTVSLAGNVLPTVPVSSNANFMVWGADISAYAGSTTELRFTSLYDGTGSPNLTSLDDIQFMAEAVPEPGTIALCCAGGMMGWWLLGRGRRTGKQQNVG
ncbi:MAG: PEP-CTERM sorting domain-containing protein [Verrucomicrobiota bacterium]